MCPTNRLRLVATVSCSAACPVRAITSSFVMWSRHEMPKINTPKASTVENIKRLVDFVGCFPCFAGIDPGWDYNGRVQDWIVQCLTSPPTQYRLYGRRFLQVKDPTNSIKVLKEATKDKSNNTNTHAETIMHTQNDIHT